MQSLSDLQRPGFFGIPGSILIIETLGLKLVYVVSFAKVYEMIA